MMKKISLLFTTIALACVQLFAQPDLPKPSPFSKLTQTVGLTEIDIEYSSPATKGRVVWGELVEMDKLWRTGANKATKITFSTDVEINGNKLSKGAYSVFSIPGKDEWTVTFNKETELWGTGNYDEAKEALRIKVKPVSIEHRERFTFQFLTFTDKEAVLCFEWEKVRVPFTIKLGTDEAALKNIETTLSSSWRPYTNAARYLLDENKNFDDALKYVNQSLELSKQWYSYWVKAQILAKQNKFKEALASAELAKELGDKNPNGFWYKDNVEAAIVEYKAKSTPAKKK
jgi:tetratricopeptide (TPR) repeat protein